MQAVARQKARCDRLDRKSRLILTDTIFPWHRPCLTQHFHGTDLTLLNSVPSLQCNRMVQVCSKGRTLAPSRRQTTPRGPSWPGLGSTSPSGNFHFQSIHSSFPQVLLCYKHQESGDNNRKEPQEPHHQGHHRTATDGRQ